MYFQIGPAVATRGYPAPKPPTHYTGVHLWQPPLQPPRPSAGHLHLPITVPIPADRTPSSTRGRLSSSSPSSSRRRLTSSMARRRERRLLDQIFHWWKSTGGPIPGAAQTPPPNLLQELLQTRSGGGCGPPSANALRLIPSTGEEHTLGFDGTTAAHPPQVVHCHILHHEDLGMMNNYNITGPEESSSIRS